MANSINGRKRWRKMDHIPYDIVQSILQYLHGKSLLRFKCISKQIHELITNPDFTDQHVFKQQQKEVPQFLLASPPSTVMSTIHFKAGEIQLYVYCKHINNVHLPYDYYHLMSGSCDGILCSYGSFYIHVFNPCTKEFRTLPKPTTHHILCLRMHTNPCYHPRGGFRLNYQLVGCGRDLVTKDYKIIRIFSPTCSNYPVSDQCEIFTLNPDPRAKWKSIGSVPYKLVMLQRPVYVNGAIYMFCDENLHQSEVIVMFDLSLENFRVITAPECCHLFRPRCPMNLVSLRGCLCLAEQRHGSDQLNLWIMKDVISTSSDTRTVIWEKFCNFSTLINGINHSLINDGTSFKFSIVERKDGTVLIYGCMDLLYLYNFKDNSFLGYYISSSGGHYMSTTFNESLVPLYGTRL